MPFFFLFSFQDRGEDSTWEWRQAEEGKKGLGLVFRWGGEGEYFVRSKYNGFLVPILPHTTYVFGGLVPVSIFLVCHMLLSEHRSAGSVFVFLVANSRSILFASFGIVLSHSRIML